MHGLYARQRLQLIAAVAMLSACTRDRAEVSPQSELERRLVRRLGAKGIRASVRCPDVRACTGVQVIDGVEHLFPIAVASSPGDGNLGWSLPGRTIIDLRTIASDLMAQRRSLIPPACELDVVVLAPEDTVPCYVLDDGIFRRLLITHHADRSHPFSWRWAP